MSDLELHPGYETERLVASFWPKVWVRLNDTPQQVPVGCISEFTAVNRHPCACVPCV